MDKPKFTRRIKFISIFLLFTFACSLSFCYYSLNSNYELKAKNFSNTIGEIEDFQSEYLESKIENNNSTLKQPLYTDGLSALLGAYEEFNKLTEVEVEILGNLFADAGILSYDIEVQGLVKKSNGVTSSETIVYCASSKDKNSASKTTLKDGIIQEIRSKNVSKINGKLVADYSVFTTRTYTLNEYINERGNAPGELFYTVNKNTVKSTSNFYIKRDINQNIKEYNTNFILSPTLATPKYVKMLQGIMDGSKNYVFTFCSGSLVLDENANLRSMHTSDKYTLDFNLFGDAFWPVTCTSTMNFIINT